MNMTGQHANPLTLWIPIKQGFAEQLAAKGFLELEAKGQLIDFDPGGFLHYERFLGVPNIEDGKIKGVMLLTDFDQAMIPYLNFFYHNTHLKEAFLLLYFIAEQKPRFPETQFVFEQYLNANNVSALGAHYYGYNASVAQIRNVFPPAPDGGHATPLTLWIEVKQDAESQTKATNLIAPFQKGGLLTGAFKFIHFARAVGIPNENGGILGILIAIEFDGAMDSFLGYYYAMPGVKNFFDQIYDVAVIKPDQPNNLVNFEAYVNAHNLTPPTLITYAYRATVAQIVDRFPPTP